MVMYHHVTCLKPPWSPWTRLKRLSFLPGCPDRMGPVTPLNKRANRLSKVTSSEAISGRIPLLFTTNLGWPKKSGKGRFKLFSCYVVGSTFSKFMEDKEFSEVFRISTWRTTPWLPGCGFLFTSMMTLITLLGSGILNQTLIWDC